MESYAENKRYVKTSDIQLGDSVLVRKQAVNKASPRDETEPLQVKYRKGTRVVTERPNGSTITRSTAHIKKVPLRSPEEAQQWSSSEFPTGPVSESTLSAGEDGRPGMGQSEKTTAGVGAGESIRMATLASLQLPQVGKERIRRSERFRKDTEAYLNERYQDFQL